MILGFLALSLCCACAIGYSLMDSDLLSPFFLFSIGFAVCGVMLWAFNYWDYEISAGTALVFIVGVVSFGAASLVTRRVFRKRAVQSGRASLRENGKGEVTRIHIMKGPLIAALLAQVLVALVSISAITGKFPAASIVASIEAYGSASKFTNNDVSLGPLVENARLACVMWTYFACYLLAQELCRRNWENVLIVAANVLAGAAIQLETGGRQGALTFVLVSAICYIILKRRRNAVRVDARWVVAIVPAMFILAFVFRYSAIGRDTSGFDFVEYMTIYCGAQIANLDIYLNSPQWFDPETPGFMTLSGSLSWLAKHFGFMTSDLSASPFAKLPFQSANGRSLGNVYTCFYNYHVDFGVLGVIACSFFMAFVSEAIYERARRAIGRSDDLWIAVYAFVAVQLLMSFFANKFFSEFFTLELLKGAVFFLVLRGLYLSKAKSMKRRGPVRKRKCNFYYLRQQNATPAIVLGGLAEGRSRNC